MRDAMLGDIEHLGSETLNSSNQTIGEERQRKVAKDHQRRSIDLIRQKETDRAKGPMTNSPSVYVDPEWAERERKEVFLKLPLLAGMSADIPEPGDKFLFEATGVPIVVVRAKDGGVNAFLNMCTHRGAKVVIECTTSKRMTCRFHAWTFDLEGNLIGMPGSNSFEGIVKADRGLICVPVVEYKGMIFVKAHAGEEEINIEAFLGSFAPEIAQLDFAKMRLVKETRLEIDANWKYALDTYGEAYHFNSLHPSSIGGTHFTDIMCYDDFDPHHRIAYPYKHVAEYMDRPEEEWPEEPFNAVHLLFPNVILNIWQIPEGHAYSIYRLYPGETVSSGFALTATYRPDSADAQSSDQPWIELHDFIEDIVINEDYSVSRDGQANLKHAPEGFEVLYGSNEIALQNYHLRLAALVNAGKRA
jgi:phenylpropionate dioxygenase-like ring-hydroxylating dioxygenase large terminal subunit